MRTLIRIFILVILSNIVLAQWELRTNYNYVKQFASDGKKMYIGRNNGITVYDFNTKESVNVISLNSELPGNYINSFMTMPDSTILVSTNGGLAVIENGIITKDKPICASYPDNDARKLYKDSSGNIWTFSSHKVHKYGNGVWKTYDLGKYINYAFDLLRIYVFKNNVWALFNDNTISPTVYYYSYVINDYTKIAVISDTGVVKLFQTDDEFPYRQGSISLACGNDDVYLKHYDSVYIYHDSKWTKTEIFNISKSTVPSIHQELVTDKKGNIWCTLYNANYERAYPVCYDEKTGKLTKYLNYVDEDKRITRLTMLEDGKMVAYTDKYFYFQNDTGWKKVTAKDCGLPDSIYIFEPKIVNGKKYVIIFGDLNYKRDGTLFCIDDGTKIIPSNTNFPYTTVTQLGIKKDGKGIFKGRYFPDERLQYDADSAFTKINLSVFPGTKILPCTNGNVYWPWSILADTTSSRTYLTTWVGNNLLNTDMGYKDKLSPLIEDFDIYNEYLVALILYYIDSYTVIDNISVYNTTDGSLQKYDSIDTRIIAPGFVIADKYLHCWIFSKFQMIELYQGIIKEHEFPKKKTDSSFYLDRIAYNAITNELICTSNKNDKFYFYVIDSAKWDSLKYNECGILNHFITHKKLLNNNVWACDDMGYMYRYSDKRRFVPFDLRINGKPNLGFPINDFTLDANRKLHLGTDIGLITIKSISTETEDNKFADKKVFLMPNPASDFIKLNFEVANNSKIEIYSVLGNKVQDTEYKDRIDVSGLSAGVYFLKTGNKVYKFVKM